MKEDLNYGKYLSNMVSISKHDKKFFAMLFALLMSFLTKRQRRVLFAMFSLPVTPAVKRLKIYYDKPGNVSKLANYYLGILGTLSDDTTFTAIATLLASATTQCGKLRDAEVVAESQLPGDCELRNAELMATEIIMDQVLAAVQKVGDGDLLHAEAIYKRHNFKIRTYAKHEKDEYTVVAKNGKFIVTNRAAGKKGSHAAYLRMISVDNQRWEVGDFSKKSTAGEITMCGENTLRIGTLYYHRTMTDSSEGKSGWSATIQAYCV